jgi:O-antigen ligase
VQQLLVSLVAVKIAGLLLIFDAAGLQSFDLPKSLFSRSMEWLIAGALVIALLRHGVAIVPRTPLHLAVGALVAVNALSAVFAENQYIAVFGEENRYLGLTFVVDMAILYLAVAVTFRRDEDWALFGGVVAVVSGLIVGYAALQRLGLDPLRWDTADAVIGTFGNSNTLGRFLSLLFGASVGVTALGAAYVTKSVRTVAAVLALAALATAALSPGRGTLLGTATVVGVLAVLYIRMRGVTRRDFQPAALIALGVTAALAALFAFTPVGASARSLIRDPSAQQIRVLLIDSAFRAFLDRPALGHGPDSFAVVYPRYRQADAATAGLLGDDAHNWLLQSAATTGALGVLAVTGAVVMSIWSMWKRSRRIGAIGLPVLLAGAAYWVHASVTIGSVGLDWFPYFAFGAAASLVDRPPPAARPRRGPAMLATAAVLAVLVVAGSLTGIFAFLANRDAAVAAFEVDARPERAVAAAESAVRRDPGRAVYWYWLGRAQAAHGEWSASSAAFREAARLSPYERAYWGHLARSLVQEAQQTGDLTIVTAAIAAARTGTEIDPNEPLTHVALAQVAFRLQDYETARAAARRTLELAPGNAEAEEILRAVGR